MDPFTAAMIAGGISSVGGALFGGGNQKPTQDQLRKQKLIDQLLASVEGYGPYSDLFNLDKEAFQTSYVDPMKQMFSSQIAPQIQQSYIAGGQQRGTGLDDTLTRAGVDMDQMLNQQYASMLQGAQQNKLSALNSLLGAETGIPNETSFWDRLGQGVGGFTQGSAFTNPLQDMLTGSGSKNIGSAQAGTPKGYLS